MKLFSRFLKAQFKRFFSASVPLFIFSTISFCVIFFIAWIFIQNMNFSGNQKRIPIGIVGDIDVPYLDVGVSTLQYVDSSNVFVDLQQLSLEEAQKLIRKGKLSAYVIIPPGFMEAVMDGSNDVQATFVTAAGAQGIEAVLKDQVAAIISTMLVNAQAGIFAMENLSVEYGRRSSLSKNVYDMNIKYIDWALDRTKFVRLQELPLSNGVTTYGYYICSAIITFIVFLCMGFIPVFTQRTNGSFRFYSAVGINSFEQIISEFTAFFVMQILCIILVFLILSVVCLAGVFSLDEWKYCGTANGLFTLFITAVPVVLMLCAFQFFVFELISGTIPAVLALFLSGFLFCFTGGAFYPLNFFPSVVQKIGSLLPVGKAISLLDSALSSKVILTNNIDFISLAICFIYTVLFIWLSVLVRSKRIGRAA